MGNVNKLIEVNEIIIFSGEGEVLTPEKYSGKRTIRAIKMRLKKERCNGERNAYAKVFSYVGVGSNVFVDVETGEQCFYRNF